MTKVSAPKRPPLWAALLPIIILLVSLIVIIAIEGADAINQWSSIVLLGVSGVALILAYMTGALTSRGMKVGGARSGSQILPAVPMLICIAMIATTWMLSGVVPTLIEYGLRLLSPKLFLAITCCVCALVSVLTGSSWSTIATIGVAFMGIGKLMGYSDGWIAGAIISGAYFGDKISPLSDTTVVASSACGVDLFKHIRYLMLSSMPAITIAVIVFACVGLLTPVEVMTQENNLWGALHSTFNITPYTLLIPIATLILIASRVPTLLTLAAAAVMGYIGIFVFNDL